MADTDSQVNYDGMFEDLVSLKNYYINLLMEEKTPVEAISLVSKICSMEMENQGLTVLPVIIMDTLQEEKVS